MAKKSIRASKRRQSQKRGATKKTAQRGGNYYLNVGGERIGGLAEVINVNDPIKPIQGASSGEFATPLYMSGGRRRTRRSARKSKRQSKRRAQKGGAAPVVAPYTGEGMPSVFTDDMMQRDFSCKTPEWTPACL